MKFIIIVTLFLAMVVGLGGCTNPAPPTTEEPKWFPDASNVIIYSRSDLEQGVIVTIPSSDIRIVPFEIRHGERIKTFHLVAISGGGFQRFFRDSKGNFVLEDPIMPWEPDTYYLYIRNEGLTSEYCKVELTIRFITE